MIKGRGDLSLKDKVSNLAGGSTLDPGNLDCHVLLLPIRLGIDPLEDLAKVALANLLQQPDSVLLHGLGAQKAKSVDRQELSTFVQVIVCHGLEGKT